MKEKRIFKEDMTAREANDAKEILENNAYDADSTFDNSFYLIKNGKKYLAIYTIIHELTNVQEQMQLEERN